MPGVELARCRRGRAGRRARGWRWPGSPAAIDVAGCRPRRSGRRGRELPWRVGTVPARRPVMTSTASVEPRRPAPGSARRSSRPGGRPWPGRARAVGQREEQRQPQAGQGVVVDVEARPVAGRGEARWPPRAGRRSSATSAATSKSSSAIRPSSADQDVEQVQVAVDDAALVDRLDGPLDLGVDVQRPVGVVAPGARRPSVGSISGYRRARTS